jgi:hypothetical protein
VRTGRKGFHDDVPLEDVLIGTPTRWREPGRAPALPGPLALPVGGAAALAAIDFISDLHLAPAMLPQTVRPRGSYLQHHGRCRVHAGRRVRGLGRRRQRAPALRAGLVGHVLAAAAAAPRWPSWPATATSWSARDAARRGMTGLPDPTVLSAWGGAGC